MSEEHVGRENDDSVNNYLASPYIMTNYFNNEECEKVISVGENLAEYIGTAGEIIESNKYRDSKVKFITPEKDNLWIFKKLQAAVAEANRYYRFDIAGFRERLQVAEYKGNGHYTWHIDVGKDAMSSRKLSVSVQLSKDDDYVGGDLEFHSIDKTKAPRSIGSTIIFPSYLLHRVTPVISGTRKSLVVWVHGPPFR